MRVDSSAHTKIEEHMVKGAWRTMIAPRRASVCILLIAVIPLAPPRTMIIWER